LSRIVGLDEADSLEIVLAFERFEGRFPDRIEHLHGSDSLGCDVVSFESEIALRQAQVARELDLMHLARLIEVKGRSSRTGAVELSENQRAAAQRFRDRYFLYRVYRNPAHPETVQIAILRNPVASRAEIVRYQYRYDLGAPSGAEWFEVVSASASSGDPVGEENKPIPAVQL